MKSTDNPGYVYILTNPSFKEDWVKIGKSSRPVDVRSKELDNTAVPLPFEIYATLQTTKFNEVEKLVHKTIDRLTDLRIRQNREFFNVRPDVALDILRDIASTLDDAVIDSYNHGNVIHVVSGDAGKDAEKTSAIRQLKNAFWKGYINAAQQNGDFKKHFSVHNGIPRYSYDLRLGTTACNIYQVAIRKSLTVGIYFHGKELFHSFSGIRNEINKIVGGETDWTEYDKDSSIVVSRDFDLEKTDTYDDAYAWLMENAVKFKLAYEKAQALMAEGITDEPVSDEEIVDEEPSSHRIVNRPPFRFSMVGIKPGEEITFIPTGERVKVVSDNQVEYEGRIYKLSPFVGTFMPADKRIPSGAYQGPKFFSYKGKTLTDLRDEIESVNSD